MATRTNRARRKAPELTWVRGDALALPFDDGSFAGATVGFGIRNVADLDRGLRELRRVLRPGGRLLIAERLARPGGWFRHHALTWEQGRDLAAQAERAGFTDVAAIRPSLGRRQLLVVRGRRPAD